MLRQLFARPTKRAVQTGGAVLLAGAMVCGSVPAYATGHLKPHEVTPIVQPDEPPVTCNDRADFEYYQDNGRLGRRTVFNWAQCVGLISEYQKYQMVKKDSVISRGQFVEYLYRLSGSPEVKNLPAQSPYADIKADDPRFPVVMWARERGITWGWSDGNFHYDAPAHETTTVIMAYRLAGSPAVKLPDMNPPNEEESWTKRNPNLPYGSELHRAYVWLKYTGAGFDKKYTGFHESIRHHDVASMDYEGRRVSQWTFQATYEQAFEVLRMADTRGAF